MKIAIIGTGISGLGAAYLLNQLHDITVYEKNDYIGGHSRTITLTDGMAMAGLNMAARACSGRLPIFCDRMCILRLLPAALYFPLAARMDQPVKKLN